MADKKFERELLETVADELNKVLDLGKNEILAGEMSDDKLIEAIRFEATGGGDEKYAIRATDFESDDAGAVLFSADAKQFFVDAGLWDDDKKTVIMPAKEKKAAKEKGAEPDLEKEKVMAQKAAKKAAKKKAAKKETAKPAESKAAPAEPKAAKPAPVGKKTAVAKKRAKKNVPAKKSGDKKPKATAELDAFGFRKDSVRSQAIAMLATRKHTMSDVVKKFGNSYYESLKKIEKNGFKVKKTESGTYQITKK